MNNPNMPGPSSPKSASSGGTLRHALSGYASLLRRNLHNFRYGINRYYLRNPASRKRFTAQPPVLNRVQQSVVESLRTEGIAQVALDKLLGTGDDLLRDDLFRCAEEFADSDRVKAAEAKLRAGAHRGVAKEFIVKRYQPGDVRSASDPLFRFGLRRELLDIVNSFAGLWTRFYDVELMYNIPIGTSAERVQSQNWHRDFTDEPTVKAFLYYRDVDENAGPLEYIPGSRRGGPYAHLWRQPGWYLNEGYYPPSRAIDDLVPLEARRTCCVPARTLVLCDTSGFHRGGYARAKPRIASVWTYLTPASLEKRLFAVERGSWINQLDAAAQFALE
jgi:hypothetical protein